MAVDAFFSVGGVPYFGVAAKGCSIKGHVSINGRHKIYEVPGREDYATTKISAEYDECWSSSEDEARAAVWRNAGR